MPLARGKTRPSAASNSGQRSPSWKAKPVARKAPSRPACRETCMGRPFQVAPWPRTAWKQSSRRGSRMQPTTGPSASQRATDTHQCGKPWTKFRVPSSGSTIQRTCALPWLPPSSPTKPCSGNREASSARMAASAARSASLTTSCLVFSVMVAGSSLRKYRSSTIPPASAAATQASRCASNMVTVPGLILPRRPRPGAGWPGSCRERRTDGRAGPSTSTAAPAGRGARRTRSVPVGSRLLPGSR